MDFRLRFAHVEARLPLRETVRGACQRLSSPFLRRFDRYRGNPPLPGLVLGLDHGGSRRGIAKRLNGPEADLEPHGTQITAQIYVVDRSHPQYARARSDDELATLVIQGVGTAGACHEYLENTLRHLGKWRCQTAD